MSVIEILATVAVLGIISTISISVMSKISNSSNLDKEAQIVLSFVTKARTESINSVDATTHGVKFTSNSVAIFPGTTYSLESVESTYTLYSATISDISLAGGGNEVYFNKLSGNPSAIGTITISSSGVSKVMTIYGTGLVEIQ